MPQSVQPSPAARLDTLAHAELAKAMAGLSPASMLPALQGWITHLASSPGKQMALAPLATTPAQALAADMRDCLLAGRGAAYALIEPPAQDRRFTDRAWWQRPVTQWRRPFLMNEQWWSAATGNIAGVQPHHEKLVAFRVRQWLDIFSPGVGVANDQRIAWGCARAFHGAGAELAVTWFNDKARPYVEQPLAQHLQAAIALPLDVEQPGQVEAAFAAIEQQWGRLAFGPHANAFAPKNDLHGCVTDRSREGFGRAMDISCHSFACMARLAEPLMKDGGDLTTMSYVGADELIPDYGLMGPVKATMEASTRYMVADPGSKSIHVNVVSAGPLTTRAASGIPNFDALLHEAVGPAPAGRHRRGRRAVCLPGERCGESHDRRHAVCGRRLPHPLRPTAC